MTHDKYDADILKALNRIARAIEIIKDGLNSQKIPEAVTVKLEKTLYSQNMPCCANCEEFDTHEGIFLCRSGAAVAVIEDMDDAKSSCCTDWILKKGEENVRE